MGTSWSVRCIADAARAPALRAAIERDLALVIAQMSPWEPTLRSQPLQPIADR